MPFYDASGAVNWKSNIERAYSNYYDFGGDGSDGAVSISGTVTLTRDMYYESLGYTSKSNIEPERIQGFRAGNYVWKWKNTKEWKRWKWYDCGCSTKPMILEYGSCRLKRWRCTI
jgi:hypothetical protein